jgi:SCP-2 sterol transfer family protein
MSNTSRAFFEHLNEQGCDPRLGRARGTLRFEVRDKGRVEQWLVALDRGAVQVSQDGGPADCVVRVDRPVLDGIVEGTVNPTAAFLRGVIGATGNFDLLLHLQRLFPAGPEEHDRRSAAAAGGHHE